MIFPSFAIMSIISAHSSPEEQKAGATLRGQSPAYVETSGEEVSLSTDRCQEWDGGETPAEGGTLGAWFLDSGLRRNDGGGYSLT